MATQISSEPQGQGGEGRGTSEAHAFIMRFVDDELNNLPGHELTRFTNTDRKFTRRTFGDSDVAVILGELDGKGSYNQNLRKELGRWEKRGKGKVRSAPMFSKENAKRRPSKTTT